MVPPKKPQVGKGTLNDVKSNMGKKVPRPRDTRSHEVRSTRQTGNLSRDVHDDSTNMNGNIAERFGNRGAFRPHIDPPRTLGPQLVLNQSIRKYMKMFNRPVDNLHWTRYREVPSPDEVFTSDEEARAQAVSVSENVVVGPFGSTGDYLERQYTLLREDAVAPLRDAVSALQETPYLEEKDSANMAYIYEKVFITGFTFSNDGPAARVTFSLRRVGNKVNWGQSKRLLTGTIVALTPANDSFKSVCRIGVVAARPLVGLESNPPEIDLFFGGPEEIEIDPQQEWLMVESRSGLYEGYRHTLQSLKMLAIEKFPLSEHIVDIRRDVPPPNYIEVQPRKDLSKLFNSIDGVFNVDILADWPHGLASSLDSSQMDALRRIISKRLALIQGPPGTGKTYVSVTAIKLLLENMEPQDPPLLATAHTNHALDQLLRHISVFEPDFIRLGGWTKDMETIKPRTLQEIKSGLRRNNPMGSLRGPALKKIRDLAAEIALLLAPLTEGGGPMSASVYYKHGILSDTQHDSLIRGAKEWVMTGTEVTGEGEMAVWLGDECIEAKQRTLPEDFGINIEEVDLEFEQLREFEAESKLVDEEDFETLRGPRLIFNESFTGRKTVGITEDMAQKEMEKEDLWNVSPEYRGPVYRRMQRLLKKSLQEKIRPLAHQYALASQECKIGGWELDYNYLRDARVIGMTTTGLSKYRGLLQALKPKVVVIEEAAEILESPVAVACFDTLEHLVLVGDHLQLRPHCNDEGLAGKPYYLGVSMFERLVRNDVEFSRLTRQRRMIPEIRRALNPIYNDLEDHPSVHDQLSVPGMGGVNSYFFIHRWPESRDTQMSKMNIQEADLIVEFFVYLVKNGMEPNEITVLTFSHEQVDCQQHCSRFVECGHACTQPCYAPCKSDCECAEDNPAVHVTAITLPLKPEQKQSGSPSSSEMKKRKDPAMPLRHRSSAHLVDRAASAMSASGYDAGPVPHDHQQGMQLFRDYAAGGHLDSDKVLADRAEQEQIDARQKRLDDENFAALFGDPSAPVLTQRSEYVNLVRQQSDAEGRNRGMWKGTFEVPRAKEETSRKEESSLMDMF